MPHDIIDNRTEKLADHIGRILDTTEAARFAVGYFFLSGLEAIGGHLAGMKQMRLLIGNTSSRETIEQIAEGYTRLEAAESAGQRERYLKTSEQRDRAADTAANVRRSAELMDQTDDAEALVRTLVRLIEEKRLEVRVYTRGRLHAKAYIFDYAGGRYEKGIAVVGSSNLTLSGLTHNTELNVVVHGNENHARLVEWFEELWGDAQDFEPWLLDELRQSWAVALATPYDIYMKSLYALVADRLDEGGPGDGLWDSDITRSLADFQTVAVKQAIQTIRDVGGVFVSDVVGLGKSYIGAAIVKHFEKVERRRPLIICPASLVQMWEMYNETYELNARVLAMSMLRTGDAPGILDGPLYRDRDFVLVDESHNFRHHTSQRYEALQSYLARGSRRVCLLTATPRSKSAGDVYNQLKLFHPEDITQLPIDPPNLKQYFKEIAGGTRRLQDLLVHVLIRRTRRHVLRYYGFAEDTGRPMRELPDGQARPYLDGRKRAYVKVSGRHQYFPTRELQTLRYSIEATYKGLYATLRQCLGRPAGEGGPPRPGQALTYARYGLWHYVLPEHRKADPYRDLHRAGVNLRGLIRVMLFKRFESSVYAFRETLRRLERIHGLFLAALDEGFVPAGQGAQQLLYESDQWDQPDLMDALRGAAGRYTLADFDAARLRAHIEADQALIARMLALVEPIAPAEDAKLQVLLSGLRGGIPRKTGKVLIFTQYADTARYLYDNLDPGGKRPDIDCVYGTDKSKALAAARFAPRANPQMQVGKDQELRILVATDVMSEGLNLQDGDVAVNYDLHWNPVRLIQRFGRIDRIGSENDQVWGFNFLPETELERHLGLQAVLAARIQEIHDTIGEDAAILDEDERVNEKSMFAIYEGDMGPLGQAEDQEGDLVDMGEAEELLRSLRQDDPAEFERIANLRDGIRSARGVFGGQGRYVLCRAGRFQQAFLLSPDGSIVSRDAATALGHIKCSRDEPAAALPPGYNAGVMQVMATFAEEVKQRRAQQQHSLSLTQAQAYVLRELRAVHAGLEAEPDLKEQIARLEQAFRCPVEMAIGRKLNTLRRSGVAGRTLVERLSELYLEHSLQDRDRAGRRSAEEEADELPRIVCSEALV